MASTLVVPVVTLQNIRLHPNASLLGLADVLGYQVVVPLVENPNGTIVRTFAKGERDEKGKRVPIADPPAEYQDEEDIRFSFRYKEDQPVVYFPADTLIPSEWAEKFGVKQLLRGKDNDRVGKIRLRGEPSFGLIVDMPEGVDWKVGDNVADFYGAKKYEPPIKFGCGDAAAHDSEIDPFFNKYTDIENGRIFVEVFKKDEEVIVTEKIHGTNCRVGIVKGQEVAGSMELRRTRPKADNVRADIRDMALNKYWFPWTIETVAHLLNDTAHDCDVVLYGEVYGGSIQELDYGVVRGRGLGFRVFDLSVNGKYVDWDELVKVCSNFGVETVPMLYRGPFSMTKMLELADGKTTLANGKHMREGIVVKPVCERIDPKIGRAVLKYIGIEYSLSKHQEHDNKDV